MAGPESYLTETELNIFKKYGMEEDVPSIGRLIGKRLKHRQEKWTTHKEEEPQGDTKPLTGEHVDQGQNDTEDKPQAEHVSQPQAKDVSQSQAGHVNEGSRDSEIEQEEKSQTDKAIVEEPKETISTGREEPSLSAPQMGEEQPGQPPIRIVLLGPEGVGKSALGNLLLGQDVFNVAELSGSGDKECKEERGEAVHVVDTPGSPFTEVSSQKGNGIRKFFTSATKSENHTLMLIKDQVKQADVIIFVLNTSHKRTPDMGINAFRKVLPPGASSVSLLVTTHADTHYKAKGTAELLDDLTESPDMRDFLDSIERRAVLVELGDGQRSEEAIVNGIAVYEKERIQARQMVMSMVKHVFDNSKPSETSMCKRVSIM